MLSLRSKVKKSIHIHFDYSSVANHTIITSGGVPVVIPEYEDGNEFIDVFAFRELTISVDESVPQSGYIQTDNGFVVAGGESITIYPLDVKEIIFTH